MFKKIALLLLSLFIAPSFLGAFNHESGNTIVAKAEEEEGDVLHGYTYTETVSPNGTTIRTYDSHALTPEIVQNFSAPMGFIFTLSVTEMQLDEIFAQAEHLGYEYDSVSTKYFYKTFGMDIEVDTFNAFYDQEDQSLKAKKEFMTEE